MAQATGYRPAWLLGRINLRFWFVGTEILSDRHRGAGQIPADSWRPGRTGGLRRVGAGHGGHDGGSSRAPVTNSSQRGVLRRAPFNKPTGDTMGGNLGSHYSTIGTTERDPDGKAVFYPGPTAPAADEVSPSCLRSLAPTSARTTCPLRLDHLRSPATAEALSKKNTQRIGMSGAYRRLQYRTPLRGLTSAFANKNAILEFSTSLKSPPRLITPSTTRRNTWRVPAVGSWRWRAKEAFQSDGSVLKHSVLYGVGTSGRRLDGASRVRSVSYLPDSPGTMPLVAIHEAREARQRAGWWVKGRDGAWIPRDEAPA